MFAKRSRRHVHAHVVQLLQARFRLHVRHATVEVR